MSMSIPIPMGFSIVPILVGVIFIIVIGGFICFAVKGGRQWHRNNQSPVLTVGATVVSKRISTSVSHHHSGASDSMHHSSSSTYYYATFQVASGDRMELAIAGTEYGMLAESDQGQLTFQGTRYQGFQRQ